MEFKESKPNIVENVFKNKDILEFIKNRNFDEKDLPLIIELAGFNKDMLNQNFHNSFQFWEGRAEPELLLLKSRLEKEANPRDVELLRVIEIYLYVLKKYNLYTVDHLNRLIENLK